MRPGEIIVVRLSGDISVRRVLDADGQRVRVALGRNREGRVPKARIALATGIVAEDEETADAFRERCEAMAAGIDLSEVWEVVRDAGVSLALAELTDLYWAKEPDIGYRVALLLHLERSDPYFELGDDRYAARSSSDVEETLDRRRRQAEQDAAMEDLAGRLIDGHLPVEPDGAQKDLLAHLRGFAVHGDNYTRAAPAKQLLQRVSSGSQDLQRLAFDLLVKSGAMSEDEPLELERSDIVEEFSDRVTAEAEAVDPLAIPNWAGRRDLTGVPTFTIDDEDTRDRDDAISVEETDGGFLLGIHIADAGALIEPNSELDLEADRRMATLYMPDRKVPMLPPAVSEGLGSLDPGQRRAALSLLVEVSTEGALGDWEVVPSIVCSDAALSYSEADRQLGEETSEWQVALEGLDRLAAVRRTVRTEAGAVMMERPDFNVRISDSGEITVSVVPRDTASRRLVTELMILCNALLADYCVRNGLPAAYRSQLARDEDVAATAPSSGLDGEYDPLREFTAARRLPPAEVSTTSAPHAGLGVQAYVQATSPLRRYPDLVTQRQIGRFLTDGSVMYSEEEVSSVAARAEVQLREISRLEDTRRRYWFLKYLLQNRVSPPGGEVSTDHFQAIVLENLPGRSALVELAEFPFRTRVQLTEHEGPGERVTIRLREVDLWTRTGRFVHVP